MKVEKYCLQAGTCMILLAIFLRLASTGVLATVIEKPEVASALLFLETGRWVCETKDSPEAQDRIETAPETQPIQPATPAEPAVDLPQTPKALAFEETDVSFVEVNNVSGYETDLQAMLQMPLEWDLTEGGPAVLILHSHGSEGYREAEGYRTTDTGQNVVSVGERLKEKLEQAGIGVVHDTTMHDQPSYNRSYIEARAAIESYLQEYPSIRLVLDIHRDAVEDDDGSQRACTVSINGQNTAQVMMVVGTDAGGSVHPNWRQNLALAVKLHAQLQKQNPGICRPISFRTQRFNQDLSSGGMLIEVGAAGNTRQEALLAAEALAEGIVALAYGTQGVVY